MINPLYHRATFTMGAAALPQLPPDQGGEVAFVGRSNVGKSSALNVITNQRALARVSKTPGRTQQINFFALDERHRLVDLPGYGYAKVPEEVKQQWQRFLAQYLEGRHSLKGVVILMDIRHPLTDLDEQMVQWCHNAGVPTCILLTKADKLSRGPVQTTLKKVAAHLARHYGPITPRYGGAPLAITIYSFSALLKQGVEEAHHQLDAWLLP